MQEKKALIKTVQFNILDAIQNCLTEITYLENLIKLPDSEKQTEIFRRTYVRKLFILGELLTIFKEKSEDQLLCQTLQQPSDNEKEWLVTKFVRYRNKFAHHYLYQHLLGDESIFAEAYTFSKDNLQILKEKLQLLNMLKQDQGTMQFIVKPVKKGTPDNIFKNDADYALCANVEITSLKCFFLSNLKIALTDISEAKKQLLATLNTNDHLRFTLENYIINSCQIILDLTESTRNRKDKTNDELRKNLIKKLEVPTQTFIYKINQIRNNLAHQYSYDDMETHINQLVDNVFILFDIEVKLLTPFREKIVDNNQIIENPSEEIVKKIMDTKAWLNNIKTILTIDNQNVSNVAPNNINLSPEKMISINNTNQFKVDSIDNKLENSQQTVSTASNINIIKNSTQLSLSVFESEHNVQRDKLYNEEFVKQKLTQRIPNNYQLGAAIGEGDCFFDVMAQLLNALNGKNEYSAKSLRLLCDEYVKSGQHAWVKEAIEKDNDNYEQYLVRIAFTAAEMKEKERQGLNLGPTVWGRPHIEGRIICEVCQIDIHLIEILDKYDADEVGIGIIEQKVTASNSTSIDILPPEDYSTPNLLHVVGYRNHFVPLLDDKIIQVAEKTSTQFTEHAHKLQDKGAKELSSGLHPTEVKSEVESKESKGSTQQILEYLSTTSVKSLPVDENNTRFNKRAREDIIEEGNQPKRPKIDTTVTPKVANTQPDEPLLQKEDKNTNTPNL